MVTTATADRELVVSRFFNAPRELVFKAFVDPLHIAEWWGPKGFTTTIHEMDVRPAGIWRFIMHGPDGTDYPNRITYVEITPPERLVYDHGDDKENDPGIFRAIITFENVNGKTKLTMRSVFATKAQRDEVAGYAVEGGEQTLNRLAEFLDRGAR